MNCMDDGARKQRRPARKEGAAFLNARSRSGTEGLGAVQKGKGDASVAAPGNVPAAGAKEIFGGVFFFSRRPRSSIRRISATKIAFVPKSLCIFPTTHWTTLLVPIRQRTEQSEAALNRLFEIYRPAIVSYVRTLVRHPQQAEDITQEFLQRILVREDLAQVDRTKGRFRAYLSTCIRHHVISHYEAEDAKKRKELNQATPLQEMAIEPAHSDNAEKQFTRHWWRATIDEAVRRLRGEWDVVGKAALFDDMEPLLWDTSDGLSINSIAARHRLTPNAVSLRKMRLLVRFRATLLAVVAETVASPAEVEAEIQDFLREP